MSKANCFRWEIWMCKLEKYDLENHFCVIVSNFKMNHKHKSIHCCLITSKLNNFKSRVDINIYEPSQVCCETILTLPKSDLLYKLKDITDVFTQLEIEKNLEIQMQLSKNFTNNDIEQIENYIMKGVNFMDDESILVNLRNNIYSLAEENKYEEAIAICNESIAIAERSKLQNKNDYLWHSTYHRSLMFSKVGNNILALEDARESLRYVGSLRDGINNRYGYASWRIANCQENLGDINSACLIYKNLSKYYKKMGKTSMQITMLFNLNKARGDIKRMQILINMVEKMNFTEWETNQNKVTLLEDMRRDVLNMQ